MALGPDQITAKNFKEFYTRILPYLNGAGANDYSTEEKIIGSWIDGKPVYQKTILFIGDGTANRTISSSFTSSRIVNGVLAHENPSNGNTHVIPVYIGLEANKLYVDVAFTGDSFVSGHSYFFTIQYTKTTD